MDFPRRSLGHRHAFRGCYVETLEACGHLSTRREWTLDKVKGFLLMDGKGEFVAGKFLKSAGIIEGNFVVFA